MADKKITGLTVQTDPIAIGDLFEMVDISEGTLSMKNKQATGTQLATFINTNLLGVAYVIGDLIYANTTTTLSKILAGTAGYVLTSNGPGTAPTYQVAGGGGGLTVGTTTIASGTIGGVLFQGAANLLQQDAVNFFWDNSNNWLGLGIASPSGRLHIQGAGNTSSTYGVRIDSSSVTDNFFVRDDGMVSSKNGYSINSVKWLHNQNAAGTNILSNTFIGSLAGISIAGGVSNNAMGQNAQKLNQSGSSNIAIGTDSLFNNLSGNSNIGIGSITLNVCTAAENIAMGTLTLLSLTTGDGNTFIGTGSGATLTTGAYNTAIGYGVNVSTSGISNSIGIGRDTVITASNQLVVGSNNGAISIAYIGKGVSQTTVQAFTLSATGITAGVSDQSANVGVFRIAGARGTGTGLGGAVVIQTATAGASGSTQNALVDQFIVKENGTINMANLLLGNAGLVSGDLYKDTAANVLANGDYVVARKV